MYYDGETETDILMKLIDTLRYDIDAMKKNQASLNVQISKVIGFVKRIQLNKAEEEETDDKEPENKGDRHHLGDINEESITDSSFGSDK